MSSMLKVMQKIRGEETAPAEQQGPPAEPGTTAEETSLQAAEGGADVTTETLAEAGVDASTQADATATPEASGSDLAPAGQDDSLDQSLDEPAAPSGFVPESAAGETSRPAADLDSKDTESDDATDEQTSVWNPKRVDPVVVGFHDRYSAICEQYRSVRARLLTMNATGAQQVIAITSSVPEEGKSVSTVNLSLVMAEGGEHHILMVDADFRRTSIARMLGVKGKPGLADVLRGDVGLLDAVQATPFPNLKLLPAGEVRGKSYGDLLGGPNTAAVLDEFRTVFDYTFVDTPPITTVSDVCLLAPYADGALMVVEMRRTPEPTVQQAVRTLQANNVKILGCILSRFRDRGSGYYEHYYSSYYNR